MSENKSIWSTADNFLTKTRKIIVNSVTALILIVITFSILGGVGSMFTSTDEIDRGFDARFVLSADVGEDIGEHLAHVNAWFLLNGCEVEKITIEDVLSANAFTVSAFDGFEVANLVVVFAEQVNHVRCFL